MSPRGPVLVSSRFCRQAAPGLGPPRPAQHGGSFDRSTVPTVGSRQFRRDRSPNRVAWRFPDWTAVGFRFERSIDRRASRPPRPFAPSCDRAKHRISRSRTLILEVRPAIASRYHEAMQAWVRREGDRGTLSHGPSHVTGGDSNPACPERFRAPVVPDGLASRASLRTRFLTDVSDAALARRRWPPTPAVPAIRLLRTALLLRKSRTRYQEPFPIPPSGFPIGDNANLSKPSQIPKLFQNST